MATFRVIADTGCGFYRRNCRTGPNAVFVRRTPIRKYPLALVVRIFSTYHDLVILRIFDTAYGIDRDKPPCLFDLCSDFGIA